MAVASKSNLKELFPLKLWYCFAIFKIPAKCLWVVLRWCCISESPFLVSHRWVSFIHCSTCPRWALFHFSCLVLGLTMRNVSQASLFIELSATELASYAVVQILTGIIGRIKIRSSSSVATLGLGRTHGLSKLQTLLLPLWHLFGGATTFSTRVFISRRRLRTLSWPFFGRQLRFIVFNSSATIDYIFDTFSSPINRFSLLRDIEGVSLGLENFYTDITVPLKGFFIEPPIASAALDELVVLFKFCILVWLIANLLNLSTHHTSFWVVLWRCVHHSCLFRSKWIRHFFIKVIDAWIRWHLFFVRRRIRRLMLRHSPILLSSHGLRLRTIWRWVSWW